MAEWGGQVAEWGGQGHSHSHVLLESPIHQTRFPPEALCVHPWPHLPCHWAVLAHGGHLQRAAATVPAAPAVPMVS